MYAISRGDLNMSAGKLAAQTGHIFKLLTRLICKNYPNLEKQYFADGSGTNVVLEAKNLNQLIRAYNEAEAAGLPCILFEDEHHVIPGTAFDGSPIITCLGIGPARRHEVDHITKRFKCVK